MEKYFLVFNHSIFHDVLITFAHVHINFIFKALEFNDDFPHHLRIYPEDKSV